MTWFKRGCLVLLCSFLFACGGGDDFNLGGDSGGGDGDGDGDGTGTAALSLTLYDCNGISDIPNGCATTSSLSIESPATVVAQLKDADGNAAANQVISLATTNVNLSAEAILTDSSGQAIATLFAQLETTGADTLSATNDNLGASSSIGYQVGQPNLSMTLVAGIDESETLSADATTSFTATITDGNGDLYTTPVDISFSSGCATSSLANLSETVTSVNGVATAIYEAQGCSGADTITATPAVSVISPQQATINIAETNANSIDFVSATPETIYLSESVGSTISVVRFRVLNALDQPKSGQVVEFALDSSLHGVSISPMSAQSNADGEVVTRVTSGRMSGTVVVTASFTDEDNKQVSATSNSLAIRTGIPTQETMSLSAETLAVEAWNVDGVTSELILRVSDENNNPVPDNTSVVFTAEGGQVTANCLTSGETTNSSCTVSWVSQNPRPKGHVRSFASGSCGAPGYIPVDVANTQGTNVYGVGRATILATTLGQETFSDANGNRVFDSGETYTALPEAWVDADENGSFNSSGIFNHDDDNVTEDFRDFNNNNEYDSATGVNNSSIPAASVTELYNGLSCTPDSETAGICTRDFVEIRDSVVIVMATSAANILISDSSNTAAKSEVDLITNASESLVITVQDLNGNQMPAGTSVSLSTDNGELSGTTSFNIADGTRLCDTFGVTVVRETSPNNRSEGSLIVEVTSPAGVVTSRSITVRDSG
ncbi:Ig-like domain-containing protein [Aliagarivorans taiwanensis]|uniref:Ig-like domain-containing protein n=1 Tax=Aliagarivorans taiwanensis TaxID=561966 RepID=UPI000412269B|nr:Ig-like domain-containing protein [Aliagarivorans taiwanensis]